MCASTTVPRRAPKVFSKLDNDIQSLDVEDPKMQEIRKIIENLDIDNLSPVEALIKLNQIKKEIRDED